MNPKISLQKIARHIERLTDDLDYTKSELKEYKAIARELYARIEKEEAANAKLREALALAKGKKPPAKARPVARPHNERRKTKAATKPAENQPMIDAYNERMRAMIESRDSVITG